MKCVNKPSVLILHPLFLSGSDLKKHAVFAHLAEYYHLIYPDIAHHGSNAHFPFTTLEAVVDQLMYELKEREPDTTFVATVGLSLGGRVALELFAREPQRFGKLFLDGIPLYDAEKSIYKRTQREIEIVHKFCRVCPVIVRKFLSLFYGDTIAHSMVSRMGSFDKESLKSIFTECMSPLPVLNETMISQCLFCFGSKEADYKQKTVLLEAYPQAELKVFDGFDHIQYCAQKNDSYCRMVHEFIEESYFMK